VDQQAADAPRSNSCPRFRWPPMKSGP
jgi:hypothetical protein